MAKRTSRKIFCISRKKKYWPQEIARRPAGRSHLLSSCLESNRETNNSDLVWLRYKPGPFESHHHNDVVADDIIKLSDFGISRDFSCRAQTLYAHRDEVHAAWQHGAWWRFKRRAARPMVAGAGHVKAREILLLGFDGRRSAKQISSPSVRRHVIC